MILSIGGSYQGKLDYVKENYKKVNTVFECNENNLEIDMSKDIINKLHILILSQLKNNINTYKFLEENMHSLKTKIIICDDISSGVVPISAEMRMWREEVGRSLALLSQNAEEVIRVFCGLGTRLT